MWRLMGAVFIRGWRLFHFSLPEMRLLLKEEIWYFGLSDQRMRIICKIVQSWKQRNENNFALASSVHTYCKTISQRLNAIMNVEENLFM